MLRTNPEPPLTIDTAKLPEIIKTLERGGFVQYVWSTGEQLLYDAQGLMRRLDGRSYHAFLARERIYVRTEYGQNGEDLSNLVIEWRINSESA